MTAAAHVDDPVLAVIQRHLAAFNARDVEAVLATFAEDAVFAHGADLVVGSRALRSVFADAFAEPLQAELAIRGAVVSGDTAACEMVERLTFEGATSEVALAAFYTIHDGRLARVKIYREGA